MSFNSKNKINIDNYINNTSSDNITKQNLSTYINKYLCDTIYILQLQINNILSNKTINKNSIINSKNLKKEEKDINDAINLIKNINYSLEKEIFCLNNSKKEEIDKFIQILCKRNELLNILMLHLFEKEKLLEKREQIINEKIKSFSFNINKRKSWNKINLNSTEGKIIDFMDKIKKHNEYYNHKRLSKYLNSLDNICQKENGNKIKRKSVLNKSYDAISINNIDTSCSYNNEGKHTNFEYKNIKNIKNRNIDNKRLRKNNSVSGAINTDSIIKFYIKNIHIKMKDKLKLNTLNIDKLNNIASHIYLLKMTK